MEIVNRLNGNYDNFRVFFFICCGFWELRFDCGIGGYIFGGLEVDSECV